LPAPAVGVVAGVSIARAGHMKITGACHCGSVQYEAEIDPRHVTICHCKDCQRLTGSAFRVSVGTTSEQFTRLRGTPAIYVKVGDSGARRAQVFCSDCGSPLWTYDVDSPARLGLRVGCVDQREALRPTNQIWCRSALPWAMDIRGLQRSDGE
jgi:hypothetical protein